MELIEFNRSDRNKLVGRGISLYDLFNTVMDNLKHYYELNGEGFWCNRNLIICNLKDMYLCIDNNTNVIGFVLGNTFIDEELGEVYNIDMIQMFSPNMGLGKETLKLLLEKQIYPLVADNVLLQSIGFWKKMIAEDLIAGYKTSIVSSTWIKE